MMICVLSPRALVGRNIVSIFSPTDGESMFLQTLAFFYEYTRPQKPRSSSSSLTPSKPHILKQR